MFHRSFRKQLYLSFLSSLVMALAISLLPVRAAHAETFTSDLAVRLVSAPKTAKSCQVFEAKFRITNHGPDAASGIFVNISTPDQLGTLDLTGVPATLAPGESVTITAVIKVVAFGPGDSRNAWVGAGVSADAYPDGNVDSNWENNNISRALKLVGKPRGVCP